jgi:hypothetical protein
LLDETATQGSSIKWTVYYEDEDDFDKTVDQLVTDLDYLKKWFAWHESWAHKDGKPVIFVWNESECEVADRWAKAAMKAGWYVVLKLFGGYDKCKTQPDSWHQYVSILQICSDSLPSYIAILIHRFLFLNSYQMLY